MGSGSFYNGYSWDERETKFDEMNRQLESRELPAPAGPCALCGDPNVGVKYHDEDYSVPYLWTEPAAYALCEHCHFHKVHKRFAHPEMWRTFLAHVSRGGYASDLKDTSIKAELAAYRHAIKKGQAFELRRLRPYRQSDGDEWFARLTMDRLRMMDRAARPRP